jgi:RNA polymerase sigma factor (sigma-70 family)
MTPFSAADIPAPTPVHGRLALTAGDVPYHRAHWNRPEKRLTADRGRTMSREQLFLSELALIERVIGWVCARRCLRGADAEDFASTVKLRFIENDYEILGRFEGRSSLPTYVTAVIQRLYLDFQAQRFGKWRPSAEARRLGPVALRLESLLYRDGLTFEEAHSVLQTDLQVSESRAALHELSLKLPRRVSRKHASVTEMETPPAASGPTAVEQVEREVLAERTFVALRSALGRLPPRDRIILRLHVEGGLSLADVARALGEDQKALYRRRDGLLKRLRLDLEDAGIQVGDAQELLATLDWESALTTDPAAARAFAEGSASGPSGAGVTDRRQEGEA